MAIQTFTLVEAEGTVKIEVSFDTDRPRVSAKDLQAALGWSVKPEGFCRGDTCIPAGTAVGRDGLVDLTEFARRIGRPLIIDADEQALSLGAAAADRADALQSLEAPDFTLPDLTGTLHSLSQYRGKKILLASYASW